jgi:glyoxylase-like metal-dependent hydrolase (beta-lactamase superfamily II)
MRILYLLVCLLCIQPAHAGNLHNYPMQAHEVSPGIYAVITPTRSLPNPENRGWNSNSAFVVTDSGVLLFDTGSSTEIGEALKNLVATVTGKPVRWIINSHAHGDHWLGNAAFAENVEKIYSTAAVRDSINSEGKTWVTNFSRMTDGATGESRIVAPDTLVNKRTTLQLGNRTIEIFPSGNSHSPGDLILWLPNEKVLITGDVVYSDRMPSTHASSLQQWIVMLDTLVDLQPEVVIPGHGDVTNVDGIKRLRSLLSDFWAAVEKAYQQGKTDFEMTPAVTAALAKYENAYPGLAEKVKRDISHVYLQVESASF